MCKLLVDELGRNSVIPSIIPRSMTLSQSGIRRLDKKWVRFTSGKSRRMFFFSSRRRHTRCLSDWSSDVCSSDLLPGGTLQLSPLRELRQIRTVSHSVDGGENF